MIPSVPHLNGLVVGILIGVLVAVAFSFPRVARAIGKIAAVVLVGIGVGLITWGLMAVLGRDAFEPLRFGPITFHSAPQTLGWGAGCLAGGVTALVLAFVGRAST